MRGTLLDALRRAYLGLTRGVVMSTDDSKSVQTVAMRLLPGELPQKIERFLSFGFHSVLPLPVQAGALGAEAIVAFLNGNRSLPVAIADIDRRTKPRNYQPGESAHHDDQGQYSKVARDGHHRVAKQHTMTAAGDGVQPGGLTKPDTTFELNEQLKGLAARVAQSEHNLHGLFDVTSQFRSIVQQAIPAVSAVAGILNQDPSGLPAMANAIEAKAQAYLQQQVQQALGKFLSPNIAGLASVLPAGLEASITGLQGQIASAMSANPIVGQVDGLVQQLADLTASGAAAAVISEGAAALQGQISALTTGNPILGTVASLRSTLQGLLNTAGPGLNFLGPQQHLVQGISRSLHLSLPS